LNIPVIAALAIILALVAGVGPASHTVLHHIVQTLPFWVVIELRRRSWAPWFAAACFLFWLIIMAAIWAFLLHLPTFVRGHFSPVEIAMTIVVGAASLLGLRGTARARVRPSIAILGFICGGVAQFAAFQVSKIPFIWFH
jgi:hypothetical protein